jgi:hypothetical protein
MKRLLFLFFKTYPLSIQLLVQWKDSFYLDMPLEKLLQTRMYKIIMITRRSVEQVPGHFAERHFAERHFAERHFAERSFCRRTFCRTDVLPNGHFAERTFCRTDSLPKGHLPKIEMLFRKNVWDCDSFLNCVILNHWVK